MKDKKRYRNSDSLTVQRVSQDKKQPLDQFKWQPQSEVISPNPLDNLLYSHKGAFFFNSKCTNLLIRVKKIIYSSLKPESRDSGTIYGLKKKIITVLDTPKTLKLTAHLLLLQAQVQIKQQPILVPGCQPQCVIAKDIQDTQEISIASVQTQWIKYENTYKVWRKSDAIRQSVYCEKNGCTICQRKGHDTQECKGFCGNCDQLEQIEGRFPQMKKSQNCLTCNKTLKQPQLVIYHGRHRIYQWP